MFRLEVRGAAAASHALDRGRARPVPPVRGGVVRGGRDAALDAEAVFTSIVNMARGRAAAVAVERRWEPGVSVTQ